MESVLWNLFLQIISGILGLWLADRYITGVDFIGPLFLLPKKLADLSAFLRTLVFIGIVLGDGGVSDYQVTVTLHAVDDKEYGNYVVNLANH